MFRTLRSEMVLAGMTNKDIAERIPMAASTFSSKMTGKYGFTLEEAEKIKKILNSAKTIEKLFERDLRPA